MRPCVGIDSPRALYDDQINSRQTIGGDGKYYNYFTTRNTPKRAYEILNGGSVFWIVKAKIVMRQTIVNIETHLDDNGKKYCLIIKDPEIMLVQPTPQRAMQGWRYLEAASSPKDLYPFDPDNEPDEHVDPQMAKDLAELGLL